MATFRHKPRAYLLKHWMRLAVCLAALLSSFCFTSAAAQPTGYQEYHVLGYEEHVWRSFVAIKDDHSGVPGQICSTVSLVATAGHQVIYYDHWEDGYEADPLNPRQSTTLVLGDGDPGNGGTGDDILRAGDAIILASDQNIAGSTVITGYVPVESGRDPTYIRYDGGDRIMSSGGPVDVVHAMWPLNNSWIGSAWEVYSRQARANTFSYHLPIGEDLYTFGGGDTGSYGDFRNVYLELGAFEDNTTVSIDNGSKVVNLTLDQGQSYSSLGYINSSAAPSITINAGTVIRFNKPTQAGLITGADSPSGGFQSRSYALMSDVSWGADYVVPVPSGDAGYEAEVYLANPNDFPITIRAYDVQTQTTFVISPTGYISATVPYSTKRGGLGYVPADSAARFTSSDGVFGVFVAADTSHYDHEWGFGAVPSKHLTRNYYVSWAPGSYDLSGNGSPVWVTPLANNTTFYVDLNKNPGGLDGIVDETFALDVLQQQRIFDPDNDNTGMHIWATGEFAVVWGQDPRTAGTSSPYLDLGVAVLPPLQPWLDPVLTVDKTASPTILPPAGGSVTFTLVAQSYNAPLVNVDITDTLPISWTYAPSSTHVTYPDGSASSPEPAIIGRALFWDVSTGLGLNQSLTLTFQARITDTGSASKTIYDGLESGTYSGGEGWGSNAWQEGGDDGQPGSGYVQIATTFPFRGNYSLYVRGDGFSSHSISRTVDLTSFTSPVLRFARRIGSFSSTDVFYAEVYNGASWTTVLTWTNQSQQDAYVQETVDLTPYRSAASAIRFRSNSLAWLGHLRVDEIRIYDPQVTAVNQGEAMGEHEYSDALFNPTDEATVYISALNLNKSVNRAEAQIGDTLVYTLSYSNLSSSITATHVMLRDAVPVQHVTFQSASGGGVYDGASSAITWALGTLAPGASGSVTCTVKVNASVRDGTAIENVGYIASDQTVEAGSNSARTIARVPEVEFVKSGATVATRGQVITYTLSYENIGGRAATSVVISDIIPISTTYMTGSLAINKGSGWVALTDAADGDQGAFISPTLVITPGATSGVIAAGESGQARFSVRLASDLPSGALIMNWATLRRNLDIPRESNVVVTRVSDLLISKAAQQAVAAPGGVISYTLTYENVSTTLTQTNVYVQEPIPAYTSFISGTAYGGNQIQYSWNNGATWSTTLPITAVTHIRWYDAQVPTRTQRTAGFAARVNAALPPNTTIHNTAHITSTQIAGYIREWIPSNEANVPTVDLQVTKSVNQPGARAGDPISYTISYANYGSADALGAQIIDTIPASTTYRADSIWGTGANASGNPMLAWNVMTVTAGAGAQQVGYAVVLDSGLTFGDAITNTAAISSAYRVVTSDPVTVTVTTAADLIVVKSAGLKPAVAGKTLTYTLVYTNSGPSDARGVTLTDTLPLSVTYGGVASVTPSLLGPTQTGQLITWYTPTLKAGAFGSIIFTVTVDAHAPDMITNGVIITSSTPEINPGDNADDEPVSVIHPSIAIVKTPDAQTARAGSTVTFTISVTNTGDVTLTNVTVSDTLAPNCGASLGGLDPTASTSYTCTLPNVTTDLTNTATVTGTPPVGADVSDTDTATVIVEETTLYGTVFDDANSNGAQDAGEAGLGGVIVRLDGATPITTGLDGGYAFPAIAEGLHTIVETDPPGYRSTTPNTVILNVTRDHSYCVSFGDTPLTTTGFASIYGTVFDDANGNGVQDWGEVGISGVAITLDGVTTTTTNLNGGYTLSTTTPAIIHTVVEGDPAGYFSTTPNTITLRLELGTSRQANFGDAPITSTFAVIYGVAFRDTNGNGTQDMDEGGMAGVLVMLDGTRATTTRANGVYNFTTTVPGAHTAVETDPTNYRSTTPNTVTLSVAMGSSYRVDFGDAPTASTFATLYGTVFDDANINGVQDVGEAGISGVTITLDGVMTTTTGIHGGYLFSTTVPGPHTVVETDPPGYLPSTPNTVTLSVAMGQGYLVDFGDNTTCATDIYEKDDSALLAKELTRAAMAHNFCSDATDWLVLTAQANIAYTITTRAWGQRTDTILALYGNDRVTLLAMNDNDPGATDFSSRIVWRAPAGGAYYVRVTNHGGLTGANTGYDVWLEEQPHSSLYLPIVTRNYGAVEGASLPLNSILAPLGVITHTLPDAYETDDTWQQAKPIVPGETQTHTFDSPTDTYLPDKDHVRFQAFPGSVVTFTTLARIGTTPTLELYGPAGDPYTEAGRWVTGSITLVWTVPDTRGYYLAAFDAGATVPATYALRMDGKSFRNTYLPLVLRD